MTESFLVLYYQIPRNQLLQVPAHRLHLNGQVAPLLQTKISSIPAVMPIFWATFFPAMIMMVVKEKARDPINPSSNRNNNGNRSNNNSSSSPTQIKMTICLVGISWRH